MSAFRCCISSDLVALLTYHKHACLHGTVAVTRTEQTATPHIRRQRLYTYKQPQVLQRACSVPNLVSYQARVHLVTRNLFISMRNPCKTSSPMMQHVNQRVNASPQFMACLSSTENLILRMRRWNKKNEVALLYYLRQFISHIKIYHENQSR